MGAQIDTVYKHILITATIVFLGTMFPYLKSEKCSIDALFLCLLKIMCYMQNIAWPFMLGSVSLLLKMTLNTKHVSEKKRSW